MQSQRSYWLKMLLHVVASGAMWVTAVVLGGVPAALILAILSIYETVTLYRDYRRMTSPPKITRPPGTLTFRSLRLLASRKYFERVFEPTYNDMLTEHCEALAAGSTQLASWIVWRWRFNAVWLLLIGPVAALLAMVKKFTTL